MSQTQCLPLHASGKQGVRKRDEAEAGEEEDGKGSRNVEEGDEEIEKNISHPKQCAMTGSNIETLQTMDAMEYLSMVHHEASLLPKVFVKNVEATPTPQKTTIGKTTREATRRNHGVTCDWNDDDVHLLPSEGSAATIHLLSSRMAILPAQQMYQLPVHPNGWVTHVLADFSSLRQCLEQQQQSTRGNTRLIPLPPLKDSGGWHEFCLGSQEAEGNIGGYYDDPNADDAVEGENDHDLVAEAEGKGETLEWRRYLQQHTTNGGGGMKPSVSLLMQMDQVMTY
jgi:hypothetical protein